MTLVELLVAMTIGLGVTLAVSSLLITGENHRRTTTSTNDAEQTGAFAFYALDRALRSAGSAIVESDYPDRGVFGCQLTVTNVLPATATFPTPFHNRFLGGAVPSNLRVAPLLIGSAQSDDARSDVLVVMGGSGAAGGVPRQVTGSGTANSLILDNTVGFVQYDLALVSQSGTAKCLIEEASAANPSAGPPLAIAGTAPYYTAGGGTITTLSSSTSTYVTPLGNAVANNLQFLLFGVSTTHTLYSYDLLQNSKIQQGAASEQPQAIADGVYQLNAVYGIDSNGDGKQDTWAAPSDAGYDIATVMTTPATMQNILAVRVALLVRGEYYDKNLVSPGTYTVFADLTNGAGTSLAKNITLSTTDQHYRYRVFEFTIPLRNMLLLAAENAP